MRWRRTMRNPVLRLWRNLDWGLWVTVAGFFVATFVLVPVDLTPVWHSLPAIGRPASPPERFLEAVRDRPPLLRAFLQQFPKGGNLHVHLSGAIYLESLIEFAHAKHQLDKFCAAGR